ncbi:hypothetical protein V6N11_017863 [Hibiscus sabdariffa]|uniref:BEACH domain-containing protein B n=1 Tax=Hibiscus sabdariffa TaxID=183260 RepID=A0ABR2T5N8_9ROSI
MNIVKGVADLIRRTSSGQTGDSPGAQGERLSPPTPRICFSEVDDEAVLSSLWERYENTVDKVEKKRLFHVFLKQFLTVFKNWEPVNGGQLPEAASTTVPHAEYSTGVNDIVVGCSSGHPAEIILTLIEEIGQLTSVVSGLNTGAGRTGTDFPAVSISFTSEGFPVLDALKIIIRSLHNCRVFGYYGGIQKITALMKGAVIQLKTVVGALSADESFSNLIEEKTGFLQRVLVYVVSIICCFIDLNSNVYEKAQMYSITEDFSVIGASSSSDPSNSLKVSLSERKLHWHRKAVVSVMEAGGLNWLVELLRVIRRLNMKEQWTDMSLQFLTLRTLSFALYDNPRGQNHFRSIGGLEVLLDGLALPSINILLLKSASHVDRQREQYTLLKFFELHVLSLEVLREAVFGNVNNLQFLCENGRVHKFANSFCSPAFVFQEYKQQMKDSVLQEGSRTSIFDLKSDNAQSFLEEPSAPLSEKVPYHQIWNDCVVKLSRVLCSFLLAPEDVNFHHGQATPGRIPASISSVYAELSIKWVMRVLLQLFPWIRACSNQNEFPNHLWVFVSTLQHCVLNAFRKVLISSAVLLEVFRKEGIWDLIFSENFFYFALASEEFSEEFTPYPAGFPKKLEKYSDAKSSAGVQIIQIEAISFVELAATSNGSVHNLPEVSALLEALEQSACNPEIDSVVAKSLLRILQLSTEKSVASFKTLNAISRVLKVACILANESKRLDKGATIDKDYFEGVLPHDHQILDSSKTSKSWIQCLETCMELFAEFFSVADDAKTLVLHDSTCIDCLFELFWEEGLRNKVFRYILDLIKIASLFEDDRKAVSYACSKYLETFTVVKEREKCFAELSIKLLGGMIDIIQTDPVHYLGLFRDGECFLHVVSLLNGNLNEANDERLVLAVLQTLTCLLAKNDASKATFGALVGKGYQTLESLLLDFCQWHPSEALLNALLDMLVDGKFEINGSPHIKNEDVVILYLGVLQKSSESLRHYGLSLFQQLLKDSLSNRASCVAAGMLNFLLDWFVQEGDDSVILKIAQLIQVIGGHSISGKDIRKIFALLRSEKVRTQQQYCSLLLTSVLSMLNEKGPTAFFDLNGGDSGIMIKTPVQWPLNKGFSFSCWLRVEDFPRNGTMGLFKFLSENGRGCLATIAEDKLIYKSINMKQQCLQMHVNLVRKKWHFLSITHTIGRTFSGGSLLRCYLDGDLISSERCSYAKVSELLTSCSIGTKIISPKEDNPVETIQDSFPFLGQIGPLYLFGDAISSEQVKAIHSLGPSYMYSFLDSEATAFGDNRMPSGILGTKDGLQSKIVFGLNAQASNGKILFNVSPVLDSVSDKTLFEATTMVGTQLCSRRLLQEIIYCVGGISVFFPLITQSGRHENDETGVLENTLLFPVAKERLTAEVIELIASVLDENLANQQQMHLLSGFSVLGFLLQSVPPQQLNMETLSALKNLFNVVSSASGLAELLMKEAISSIFLDPHIWLYTAYVVQRELYMFLIEQFDNNPRLLTSLCQLPRVIDIIRQCYWDSMKSRFSIGGQPLLHPVTKRVIGERPGRDEIHKIRLLLLSLGELSLRQNISSADIKALASFFETSHDMTCVEDVLHMVIRAVSHKPLLLSFIEQVNLLGGCHIFVNLLKREHEPIRLLSLQFLGRLLVGFPSEKKGPSFFNLAVGRSKSFSENNKKVSSRMQLLVSAISDRLFNFPQTDNLCATLFDVLLGGASPRQVLQKNNLVDKQKISGNNSHFFVPQILILIFKYLSSCGDASARMKIISDLLDLLDSNPLNIEALVEYGWNAWLTASVKLDVVKNYTSDSRYQVDYEVNEKNLVMTVFSVVLCHYIQFIKGGWQQLEETVNFLLLHCEQVGISFRHMLCDIYDNLLQRLVDLSAEENIFSSQPCRDNTLYLLRLVDEMLISAVGNKLPFPANSSESYLDSLEVDNQKDYITLLHEVLQGEFDEKVSGNLQADRQSGTSEDDIPGDNWWNLLDNLWVVISEMNGMGPSKTGLKNSASVGPSFGQRARGLVESLNIPAAEMAAVVSVGIGNALSGKPNKTVDKAMALRGERCPRIVFRLLILYLCRSSLERALHCVQQFIALLPCFLATEDEQSKSRLQLIIWSLLIVRSQYGMLDNGARFHVIAHVIRETMNSGKSILATSMVGREDSFNSSSYSKETGSIHNLIQKDRVLSAVSDESKYVNMLESDRSRQLEDLRVKMVEISSLETHNQKTFEDEIQSSLQTILASDERRRAAFLLAHEEHQQNVNEKWMHMLRTLIDERGPWSANPFPNRSVIHWKLDKTEDSWRRRPKLRRNYHFDEKICFPPSASPANEASLPNSESKSSFVGNIPGQMKQFLLKGARRITDEGSSEPVESGAEPSGELVIPEDPSDSDSVEVVKSISDQIDIVQDRKELSAPSPETESSEVVMSLPCLLVTPKRKLAGQLAVMKDVLHFFGEILVEGTAGSSVFKNLNASGHFERGDLKISEKGTSDNVEAENLHKEQLKNVKRHRRWSIGKIKAVRWTRYLLRYTAIEIFFSDSIAPIFINFTSQKEAKEIGTLIVSTRNELLSQKGSNRDKNDLISFVDRRVALEMAETARESWRRRDITNFEYLMILNTLAGRSYNDLTQYPVFPWVLADYSSEFLDFNKSSTFRDLSKPVGALDSKRFEVFEDRYRNFCDPDIPSFYYGSHYSSMGIVLYYLLRLEPFTSLHRNLQGGKFDHADRLFQSVESTYRNCLSNTSDVKELVPEFYYMPEFLINSNSYHLGVKQDGEPINDVSLPPWAKGSPELFISKNREALESEYVSSNLHHWIDLVFGYKQRGKPAVEAANVFYYLTYEGAVDMDSVDDELQRSAIEDQIANFGQTPIQVFRKRHPRRGPPIPIAHPLYFAPASISLTSIVSCITYPPSAVMFVGLLDSNIVIVNQGLTLSVKMWLTTQLHSGGNFTFSGSQDPFFGVGSDMISPRKIGSPLAENVEFGAQCFATMQTPTENFLISCGNWENSFQVTSLSDGRMVQSVRHHKDVVSCVAVTADGSIVATGSHDTTVMVWEVLRVRVPEKRVRNMQIDSIIAETPFHILCGHDDIITCLFVSVELDVVISGSKDGTCVFHTLREGRYVRSLLHPSRSALSKLVASRHGRIVLYSDGDLSLNLYSINGKHLASSESNGRLNCVELSACGEFLVCAGDQGQIVVRSMNTLEVVQRYNGVGKIVTSLTVTPEECFLAGTKDGSLLVYSIENPQVRKGSASLNQKTRVSFTG